MKVRPSVLMVMLCTMLTLAVLLASSSSWAQGEFDPSVFSPNGVVYKFEGSFSVIIENATPASGPLREVREGNFTLVLTIFSKEHGSGYHAWSFSMYIEQFNYNRPEELPEPVQMLIELLGVKGVSVPPLVAVKDGTRETYFLINFHELERTLSETNVTGLQDLASLASKVMAATGEVNEEVYFTNPFYIPLNVSLGTEIVYGVYNKTSGQQVEVKLRVNDEGAVEAAGKTYDAWIIRLDEEGVADILEGLGVDEEAVEATRSVDLNAAAYYDKATGWLLGYEVHGHAVNTTTIERDGRLLNVTVRGDVDLALRLVEPGTIEVGGESLIERALSLPRNTALLFAAGIIALAALLAILKPREVS